MKPTRFNESAWDQHAERRAQQRLNDKSRKLTLKSWLRTFFLVFAGFALVALVVDLSNFGKRSVDGTPVVQAPRPGAASDILAGLDGPRYEDPRGFFSLIPPHRWVRLPAPPAGFFDVVFQGPYGMDMSIQVIATNQTFSQLEAKLRKVERNLAADTHITFAFVGEHRAIKRTAQLFRSRVLFFDFLTGNLAHHVQVSMPPELFDEYEPLFIQLMQSYTAGRLVPEVSAFPM